MSDLKYKKRFLIKGTGNSEITINSNENDNYYSQKKKINITYSTDVFSIAEATKGLANYGTYTHTDTYNRVVYNIANATKTTRYIKVYKLLSSNKLKFLGEGKSVYQDYTSICVNINENQSIVSYRSWGDSWGFVIAYHPNGHPSIPNTYYITFTYPNTIYTRYIILNVT